MMLYSLELLDVAEGLNFLHTNNFSTGIFSGVGVFFGLFRAFR